MMQGGIGGTEVFHSPPGTFFMAPVRATNQPLAPAFHRSGQAKRTRALSGKTLMRVYLKNRPLSSPAGHGDGHKHRTATYLFIFSSSLFNLFFISAVAGGIQAR
jgi:hypothetical protein